MVISYSNVSKPQPDCDVGTDCISHQTTSVSTVVYLVEVSLLLEDVMHLSKVSGEIHDRDTISTDSRYLFDMIPVNG
jgi:hypothetical protein